MRKGKKGERSIKTKDKKKRRQGQERKQKRRGIRKVKVHSNIELKGSSKTIKAKREVICTKLQWVGGRSQEVETVKIREKEKVSKLEG